MKAGKLVAGQFADFVMTGTGFLTWLVAFSRVIFVRKDFFAKAWRTFEKVSVIGNHLLDRNEILIIPTHHRCLPISVSWNMPILFAPGTKLSPVFVRGFKNCMTCQHEKTEYGSGKCVHRDLTILSRYRADLGRCVCYEDSSDPRIPYERNPKWWEDSDWAIVPSRYCPLAFDPRKIERLVACRPFDPGKCGLRMEGVGIPDQMTKEDWLRSMKRNKERLAEGSPRVLHEGDYEDAVGRTFTADGAYL